MTIEQLEEKYQIKCEKMKNPYKENCNFWVIKDIATNEELGRCATIDDIAKTLKVVKGI